MRACPHGPAADLADPWTAGSGLLALRPSTSYTPTMVICGGSNANDKANPKLLDANAPTVAACYRMDLTDAGIRGGWQNEDPMPNARVMPQMVQMPCVVQCASTTDARSDGSFLIVHGGGTGVAGCASGIS